MEKKKYTQAGYDALLKELNYLETVKKEENKKEISTARAFGDLSENSEYDAAKQEQAIIAARILELKDLINNAEIVDDSEIDESRISIGSIVVLYSVERGCELTYHIVGSFEADPKNGKISDSSPIGAALLGAREGEEVVVEGARVQHLQVRSVSRAK
ncbi:MAG: transcription elongation factor GreA [Clostridia bacterium]|nr:transcription elongation factor GreA [Clostridia bacterium]MBR3680827.1 transcription elongation factor GreA [Clostridia bacterium]